MWWRMKFVNERSLWGRQNGKCLESSVRKLSKRCTFRRIEEMWKKTSSKLNFPPKASLVTHHQMTLQVESNCRLPQQFSSQLYHLCQSSDCIPGNSHCWRKWQCAESYRFQYWRLGKLTIQSALQTGGSKNLFLASCYTYVQLSVS